MEEVGYHERAKILAIVGPTAVGKTAVIHYLLENYPDNYHHVKSFTTRERRPDDKEGDYEFITEQELTTLQESGEVVQMFQHPGSGKYYGTLRNYYHPSKINIAAFLAHSVDELQAEHETEIAVVGLLASEQEWMRRVDLRYPEGHADRSGRIKEAELCRAWLENGEHFVIWNDASTNEPAAEEAHERMKMLGMA